MLRDEGGLADQYDIIRIRRAIYIVLAALGGCWWPIEITPDWIQKLQLFLPTGWAMDALHNLSSFAAGPASVLPHLTGMSLAALVCMLVAVKVFRYE